MNNSLLTRYKPNHEQYVEIKLNRNSMYMYVRTVVPPMIGAALLSEIDLHNNKISRYVSSEKHSK